MKTNRNIQLFSYLIACMFIFTFALTAVAAERTLTQEEMEALAGGSELAPVNSNRPAKLPDLTKGEKIPVNPKTGEITWNLGPTGIIGVKNGGFKGDQVFVNIVMPGSPAQGKIKWGDVIVGVSGKDFVAGGHMGYLLGNEIVESEREKNKGILKLKIWRDRNFLKRNSAKDIKGVDIDELFRKAEEDGDIYDWKEESEQKKAVENVGFDEFPIDGYYSEVTLQLKVMGTYSENSPWDCPVTEKIREDACKVIAKRFEKDKRGRTRACWLDAIALVASGKEEYRQIVHDWVRKQKLCRDINARPTLKMTGMLSWRMGFNPLELAIYYDATGDKYVLPELRYKAIQTAMGQNGGGSWGHTFAFPVFNGGRLHGRNPGYGAMNNAGGRCFFLLTLAQKAGIKHPEIDAAIERARRFFGTYVDKGAVPYGFHLPAATDDSNGKNYGPAYAFKVLGDLHEAKYYSQLSTHASFTRRGGHGSPTLWYYTPLSANICGPKGTIATMRNMRWFYTLSRRHDGSFVFQGEQAGIGGKPARSPSSTLMLYYSAPLRKLVTTGKEPAKSIWHTDEDMKDLLASARSQVNDPALLKRIGKPWNEQSTDYLFGLLDHFKPKMRGQVAREIGKRYLAGEKKIAPRLVKLLKGDEPRYRGGACLALQACGTDVVLSNLSKLTPMLKDKTEFVRMEALRAITKATGNEDRKTQQMMLEAAADDYDGMMMDHGNVRTIVKGAMFPRRGANTKLTSEPFEMGFDDKLVHKALSGIIEMDPGGYVSPKWSKDTLIRLAGPIVFVSDEVQLNDKMFGYARTASGLALLGRYGYREAIEGEGSDLFKRYELERQVRRRVRFSHVRSYIRADIINKYRGSCRDLLDPMKQWLLDDPLATVSKSRGKGIPPIITPVDDMIRTIEGDSTAPVMPGIYTDVERLFRSELSKAGGTKQRVRLCRNELTDLERNTFFRKMAAMSELVDMLAADAADDLVPYFAHAQWRLRKHSRKLAAQLVKQGAANRLIKLFSESRGKTAAAILTVLADTGTTSALQTAKLALKSNDPVISSAAVQAVSKLGGDSQLTTILSFMHKAKGRIALQGCEKALLLHRNDKTFAGKTSSGLVSMLPGSGSALRGSIYWVLAQLGGEKNLVTVYQAGKKAEGADFQEIVVALSYSPDRLADRALIALAKLDDTRAKVVAELAYHRMVIGPDGIGTVSDKVKMDFASPMLKINRNVKLIKYLSKVHTGRSITALMRCMRLGPADISAQSIISAADGMANAPAADRKIAADGLQNVIEFIEVTQLRGGIKGKDWRTYPFWKAQQTRAGKAMLKVYKPEKAPIPEFDDLDLDF